MSVFIESIESRLMMSATPLLTTAQKQDLKKLGADLTTIHAKSTVTTSQVTAVLNDFKSIAEVSHLPSSASVQKLKTDTKAAFSDKKITPAERALLTADVDAVLTSAGVPMSLAKQTAADIKAVVISTNITSVDVNLIVTDVETLVAAF